MIPCWQYGSRLATCGNIHRGSRVVLCHHNRFIHRHAPKLEPGLPTRSKTPNAQAKDIAILGGGITGLSSAFFITQEIPQAKITIYEDSTRLGGWLDSPIHDLDNGHVVFENGPRTLRQDLWNGYYLREIVRSISP